MKHRSRISWQTWTLVLVGLVLAAGAAHAQTTLPPECVVPPNTTGTVTLPPPGCEYLSADQVHLIINGLPQDTVIVLDPIHERFICETQGGGNCGTPGGKLGGEVEVFGSTLTLRMSGTGALAGWTRTIPLSANSETHTGPRTAGAVTQTFPTLMNRLEGTLVNDPDFASLHIVAGTANGYPSPGSTTLTRRADGTYKVDSQFTIRYRIDFQGAPGGRLAGLSGSTEGSVTMRSFDLQGQTPCN